jgi:hypothetical protein
MIEQDYLREIFRYDEASGNFIRIKKTNRKTCLGDIAGTIGKRGHVTIAAKGKRYTKQQIFDIYHIGKFIPNNRYRGTKRDECPYGSAA